MQKYYKKEKMQTGIALYLAVLVGTIVITASLGISTIFYRELRISGLQFPSLTVFYMADTGKECALYHDIQNNAFDDPFTAAMVTCQGITQTISSVPGTDANGSFYSYSFQFTFPGDRCAFMRIKKQIIGGIACTRIDSYGENDNCGGGSATVQRSIVSIDPETCSITSD